MTGKRRGPVSAGSVLLLAASWLWAAEGQAENWPRFRGPNGTGISREKGFPSQWSEGDWLWKTAIPGLGHSSPCVWQDHLFLTSALDEGRVRLVLDVSAATGKIRWVRRLASSTHKKNRLNSYASATPATDGKRVYVAFACPQKYAVTAYDFDGHQLWSYDLGPLVSQHGQGASPIVFEDLVIIPNDQDGPSFVAAIDSATGKLRWKAERAVEKAAFSTPMIIKRDGHDPEVVFTSWADGITGYDARTGRLNWQADVFVARAVGSPVYGHGLVFATCGGGGRGIFMAAVRPNGTGLLDESAIAWSRKHRLPYVPVPVLYGDYLYLWGDNGVVVCVAAETGKEVWTERVGGIYSASPIWVDGRLYCVNRSGEVVVIAAGPEFKLLGRTELGERCHATPAVSNGRMFFRGFQHLFCLPANKGVKEPKAGAGE